MIVIRVSGEGGAFSLKARGHAGYAPEGRDIVCAAVSTAVFGLARAIRAMDEESDVLLMSFSFLKGAAEVEFIPKERAAERGEAVFFAFVATLRMIEEAYPKYVKIE